MRNTRIAILSLTLLASACGSSEPNREIGGGATGAGTGAVIGLLGGPIGVVAGAVIGGAVGAGTGAVVPSQHLDLGTPPWSGRSHQYP